MCFERSLSNNFEIESLLKEHIPLNMILISQRLPCVIVDDPKRECKPILDKINLISCIIGLLYNFIRYFWVFFEIEPPRERLSIQKHDDKVYKCDKHTLYATKGLFSVKIEFHRYRKSIKCIESSLNLLFSFESLLFTHFLISKS
jgi:hypothetical protein